MNTNKAVIFALSLMLMFFLQTAGCFLKPHGAGKTYPDIVWPKAPETPRIRFLGIVSKPEDFNIHPGVFKKIYHYLAGANEASIVSPYGVTRDAGGRLYVVDTFLEIVHVFDPGANTCFTFPAGRKVNVAFIGIAADDKRGLIYLSDSKQGVVKIFSNTGKQEAKVLGEGMLKRPTGIAVNPKTSELLVVDTVQARVFRFDLSDYSEKGSFGGNGKTDGRFHYPTNIAVTPAGNIVVSDSLNFRVQVFSREGRFLMKFGRIGQSPGCFSRPKGVAVDSDGNIYVVDALFDNIQVFDKSGRLLMAFGGHGAGYGEFWLPTGIYIDKNDIIYVSDFYNRRLQMFQYLKGD
ncbi:MAG: 6-bladed beta-propeller [Deltaproteobacteria bacterium]|nr:6-bladed beta-propeller [Deltaproteobacteria bacterium]